MLYEESTGTLMCGDLFTQLGNGPALTEGDVVGPAIAAEDMFKYSCLNPGMGATIRGLSNLAPRTLDARSLLCGRWRRRPARLGRRLRPPHFRSGVRGEFAMWR